MRLKHNTALLISTLTALSLLVIGLISMYRTTDTTRMISETLETTANPTTHSDPPHASTTFLLNGLLPDTLTRLRQQGFHCEPFINAVGTPMTRCSRTQGKHLDFCADSIWLEHDRNTQRITHYTAHMGCEAH